MGSNCSMQEDRINDLKEQLSSLRVACTAKQKRVSRPLDRVAQQEISMREANAKKRETEELNENTHGSTNNDNSFQKQAEKIKEAGLTRGGKSNRKRSHRKRSHHKRSRRTHRK